jgi:hypothetical protein
VGQELLIVADYVASPSIFYSIGSKVIHRLAVALWTGHNAVGRGADGDPPLLIRAWGSIMYPKKIYLLK